MPDTRSTSRINYQSQLSFQPLIEVYKRRVADHGPGHRMYEFLLTEISKVPALNESKVELPALMNHRALVEDMINSLFPVTKNNNDDLFAVMIPYSGELVYTSRAFSDKFGLTETGCFLMPESDKQWNWEKEKRAGAFMQVLEQLYHVQVSGEICTVQCYTCRDTGLDRYLEMKVDTSFTRVCFEGELPPLPPSNEFNTYRFEDLVASPELMDWLDLDQFLFQGFATLEIRDVTEREVLDSIRNSLLDLPSFSDTDTLQSLQKQLENLLGQSGLRIGVTPLFDLNGKLVFTDIYNSGSILIRNNAGQDEVKGIISILENRFKGSREPILIPQIDESAILQYSFLVSQKDQGIHGLVLIPLFSEGRLAGTMEIAITNDVVFSEEILKRALPAVPLFEKALQNISEKLDAQVDKVIKEQFTAVQPSVEWKFNEAALEFVTNAQAQSQPKVPSITFDNVFPLYGAIDIRNSSTERNKAIQNDLLEQLQMASEIIRKARKMFNFPLLREINYKIRKYRHSVENIVLSDEEMLINHFLKHEVVKLFHHLAGLKPDLKPEIDEYFRQVTTPVDMLYKHRKNFDESITMINATVAEFIDREQAEAQRMYPHYFERFVTDGVDFNIYVGQSINPGHPFDKFYLKNIKLWQLSTLAKAARMSRELESKVSLPLQTTQLILAHSNPISISFRPAERKFDVDGAYNIRYEIIKKRIDKVCIRDTNERLTKPGTIAIVYSSDTEAKEYEQYVEFLQHEGLLAGEIERFDLEELQGVSGLKALRVAVAYDAESSLKASAAKTTSNKS